MTTPRTALRLALATPDYPPDPMGTGIGTYAKSLAEGLAARGHRVHVVTRGPEGNAVTHEGGVTIHRIGVPRPSLPATITPLRFVSLAMKSVLGELTYRLRVASALDRLVREEGVQLVEAADSFVEALFFRPRRHPTVPFVIRFHTPMSVAERFDRNLPELARRLLQTIERAHVRRATHLTVPSSTPLVTFRTAMRTGSRPIEIVPNPPPSGWTSPGAAPARAASENAQPPVVLYLGRVTTVKGVHVLAEAIPRILEAVPDATFLLVGADSISSSGIGSTVEEMQRRLPEAAATHVRFEGRVPLDRVGAYLEQATVCVFPSLFENFPYSCLEAMTFGKAIVGSASGGMRDMLDDGACGLLYHPPDAQELAAALTRLLREPALRTELGKAAFRRAHEVYGAEEVFDATVDFYRRSVEDCKTRGGRRRN